MNLIELQMELNRIKHYLHPSVHQSVYQAVSQIQYLIDNEIKKSLKRIGWNSAKWTTTKC